LFLIHLLESISTIFIFRINLLTTFYYQLKINVK
ncbi:putative membrane protein, partial [Escherichia coli P02997067.6]